MTGGPRELRGRFFKRGFFWSVVGGGCGRGGCSDGRRRGCRKDGLL